jgi:hypothetical protein
LSLSLFRQSKVEGFDATLRMMEFKTQRQF